MPISKHQSEYSIASLGKILPNSTMRSTDTFQDPFNTTKTTGGRRRSVFLYPFSRNRKYDSFLSAKDYETATSQPNSNINQPTDDSLGRNDFTRLLARLKASTTLNTTRSRNSVQINSTSDLHKEQQSEIFGNYYFGAIDQPTDGSLPKSTTTTTTTSSSLLQRIFRRKKPEKWNENSLFSVKVPQVTNQMDISDSLQSPHLTLLISKFPTIDSPNGSFVWPDPTTSHPIHPTYLSKPSHPSHP
ncbi:hypothetical protein J3Q64DRAFT_1706544 [Phycomyces blakesleeanus]|uniref:Uncharacterized protein n=1 Tax=Phycomyces blakesleeanus TaxID=4837 RepID=A0ABR3BBD1_PHYBL